MTEPLSYFFMSWTDPYLLFLTAAGTFAGIYLGGVYGGSRSAILLNIPGAPAAIATALDGYPLAKRGEAGTAIGLTTVVSVFGGFIGIAARGWTGWGRQRRARRCR